MLSKRLIACLDVRDGNLAKSVKFVDTKDIGDPVAKAREYYLDGLDEFSHIMVVFWMHLVPRENRPPTRIHPRGRTDLPLVGLFATRAPHRPNPIGVSVVKLLRRHDNILTVAGLDAINGTPVLDIKSYMTPVDKPEDIRMPDWVSKIRTQPRP